jgi:hypothetical protein
MRAWTADELDKIGNAEELEIAPLRRDATESKWVTIWVIRVRNDLYVRSYKGSGGSWYRHTQLRHEGRIRAGGVEKDVIFAPETDPGINDEIDAVYRTKYGSYSAQYIDPMVAPSARATTIKLTPR